MPNVALKRIRKGVYECEDYRVERRDGGYAFGIWWLLTLPNGKTEECDTLQEARETIFDYINLEAS